MRTGPLCAGVLAFGLALVSLAAPAQAQGAAGRTSYLDRLPQDEIIYFLLPDRFANGDPLNDRGGLKGDRLATGFDPTDSGFFQGGDLKGLTERLDYIQALGATAIWLGPVYKNKPVQGKGQNASAGYHGYWITDFLSVDPHFGTKAEMKAFVDAAHRRGLKVYLDVIINHTADVIQYRECPPDQSGDAPEKKCDYRSIADYPWSRRGGVNGAPINDGFRGDGPAELTRENFAKITRSDYAYTPYIPAGQERVKNPPWLNDLQRYHNRGETTFEGENSLYGDFIGNDDFMTEDPVVVAGMIDIFKQWISDYRIDGFRIDTIKHVRPEAWQAFIPAIEAHAKKLGIKHFHTFGEAYAFEPHELARYTKEFAMPSVIDFGFQRAATNLAMKGKGARDFERLFDADIVYANGPDTAAILPTFLGNHDMGRIGGWLTKDFPAMTDAERVARIKLAHALMMFSRGVPVIYSGDEQGFASDGHDKAARESFFRSQVSAYLDNDLIGTNATHATDRFDTSHPIFRAIAEMARLRAEHAPLRRGRQVVRHTDRDGGVMALSRLDRSTGWEYVVVFNAETSARSFNIQVEADSRQWQSVRGACAPTSSATPSYAVTAPALDYIICRSVRRP
ncbi:MAG: alpha-amylase family glycosyl hydrolase [Caulobacterales bacterium]